VVGAAIVFRGAVAHHLGVLARALGRREEAAAHLERALDTHRRLGARPWSLRTRCELAELALEEPAGREEALAALRELEGQAARLDLGGVAGRAGARLRDARASAPTRGVFRRHGATWTLGYRGSAVRMRDAKGLADTAALLRSPGRPVHAADLVAATAAAEAAPHLGLGADEVLDERARRELRARLVELEEEGGRAERRGDGERAAQARAEREALVDHLAAAAGLRGRSRRLGDPLGACPQGGDGAHPRRPGPHRGPRPAPGRPPARINHHRHLLRLRTRRAHRLGALNGRPGRPGDPGAPPMTQTGPVTGTQPPTNGPP
jgi:hypothetical protein